MQISQSPTQPTISPPSSDNTIATPTQHNVAHINDEKTYSRVFSEISDRYNTFDQKNETGYQDKKGVTGNIENISKEDLISILKHIKSDPTLLEQCRKGSAKSPIFTKLYLMSNDEQGWNLRLHTFSVKGNGLGGEDSPPYHRWTLASKIITGGYVNVEYKEGSIDQPHAEQHEYAKYELGASKNQNKKHARQAVYISEATMTPTQKKLYAKGDLNHFPIKNAHSVETHSSVMGTTVTLAHTAKPVADTAYIFEKNNTLTETPLIRIESNTTFEDDLQDQITLLQVLCLSSNLNELLNEMRIQSSSLKPYEENHLNDFHEQNYIETSLLPSLAIYQMESFNGITGSSRKKHNYCWTRL